MPVVDYEVRKSIREAFGKKLAELGAKDSNIVVLDATLSEDEIANEAYVCVLNALNGQ